MKTKIYVGNARMMPPVSKGSGWMFNTITEDHFRTKMRGYKKSPHVIEGMELIDVMLADMDREKSSKQPEKEKNLRSGRSSLRKKLLSLLAIAILPQETPSEKSRRILNTSLEDQP
jgi:uncharacterized protein YktB (UPF0637 family)